jgi:hypothetical protein
MPQLRGFLQRFRRGQPLWSFCDHVHHNRVADILENILGCGCRIEKPIDGTPWKIIVDGSSDITGGDLGILPGGSGTPGFPRGSTYTFGITATAADKLKVWKGKLRRWGDQTYNATDTEVTFSGDGDQWLVWRWSESSGLEIVTTPQLNYPAESDSTYIYGPIHKVNLTDGVFTLLESVQTGIINAPIFTVAGA